MSLVRSNGLEQLTMRALAAQLDATPMAIYKHVAGREELELLVVEKSFEQLTLPPMELSPLLWLEQMARAVRVVGLAHPGVMDFLLEHGPVARATLVVLDHTVQKLHGAGLSWKEAGELHNTFFSWLAGAVRRQQHLGSNAPASFARFFAAARALPREQFPALARTLRYMERLDFDAEFEISLRLMLDAVADRIRKAGEAKMQKARSGER